MMPLRPSCAHLFTALEAPRARRPYLPRRPYHRLLRHAMLRGGPTLPVENFSARQTGTPAILPELENGLADISPCPMVSSNILPARNDYKNLGAGITRDKSPPRRYIDGSLALGNPPQRCSSSPRPNQRGRGSDAAGRPGALDVADAGPRAGGAGDCVPHPLRDRAPRAKKTN